MKEDWLHKIHDRMADFEMAEPDGLWARIEEKSSPAAARRGEPGRVVPWRWRRWISAAAILLAVVSAGLYFIIPSGDGAPVPGLIPDMSVPGGQMAQVAAPGVDAPLAGVAMNEGASGRKRSVGTIAVDNSPEVAGGIDVREEDKAHYHPSDSAVTERDSLITPQVKKPDYRDNDAGCRNIASVCAPRNTSSRMSFSVKFSSGAADNISGGYSAGDPLVSSIGSDNSGWEDNPVLGILLFNRGKDIKTSVKHRLPVRVGLTVAWDFNDRMGIESGLSYTRLSSDVREGSDSHYFTGEQKLQYIGVPVNFKYRAFSLRRLDFYASAGILGEKCVSADVDKKFVIDNQDKGGAKERLRDRPFQLSVNASVGLQFNIINKVGLFVEPGVSYYFDDGSSIRHVYRDRPLNFNLNTGLRFTPGR